jgi:hypothetical protein
LKIALGAGQQNLSLSADDKAKAGEVKLKSMLIILSDHKEILHKNFIAQGESVNQQFCLGVLGCLRDDIRRKCPDK